MLVVLIYYFSSFLLFNLFYYFNYCIIFYFCYNYCSYLHFLLSRLAGCISKKGTLGSEMNNFRKIANVDCDGIANEEKLWSHSATHKSVPIHPIRVWFRLMGVGSEEVIVGVVIRSKQRDAEKARNFLFNEWIMMCIKSERMKYSSQLILHHLIEIYVALFNCLRNLRNKKNFVQFTKLILLKSLIF